MVWVRFPSPAPFMAFGLSGKRLMYQSDKISCAVANLATGAFLVLSPRSSGVEHSLGKGEAIGSIPIVGTIF
jgi:hypothetical protein